MTSRYKCPLQNQNSSFICYTSKWVVGSLECNNICRQNYIFSVAIKNVLDVALLKDTLFEFCPISIILIESKADIFYKQYNIVGWVGMTS